MNLFGIFQTLQGKKRGNPPRPPEVCSMAKALYPGLVKNVQKGRAVRSGWGNGESLFLRYPAGTEKKLKM